MALLKPCFGRHSRYITYVLELLVPVLVHYVRLSRKPGLRYGPHKPLSHWTLNGTKVFGPLFCRRQFMSSILSSVKRLQANSPPRLIKNMADNVSM